MMMPYGWRSGRRNVIKNSKQYSSRCFDHRKNTFGDVGGGILIVLDMGMFTTNSLICA